MQKRNNILAGLGVALLLFGAALLTHWINEPIVNGISHLAGNAEIFGYGERSVVWQQYRYDTGLSADGLNGSLQYFGIIALPIWLLLLGSAVAVLLAASNTLGWTTIPRRWLAALLLFCAVHCVAVLLASNRGSEIGIGPWLALLGAAMGCVQIFLDYCLRRKPANVEN